MARYEDPSVNPEVEEAILNIQTAIKRIEVVWETTQHGELAEAWAGLEQAVRYLKGEEMVDGEPANAEELRAYVEEHANLVFNIGAIIEDRETLNSEDEIEAAEREYALWRYLYDNLDALYERMGPIIDEVEDAVVLQAGT